MSKEKNTVTIDVPKACKIAAYGHMVFDLKKGKNEIPKEHIEALEQAAEDSGIFKKPSK